jgi:hypothetical protein
MDQTDCSGLAPPLQQCVIAFVPPGQYRVKALPHQDSIMSNKTSFYMSAYTRINDMTTDAVPDDTVRWNIKVSKEADRSVRGFLAQRGLKKGDLSKFVEEAVCWRVLRMTVDRVRVGFAGVEGLELEKLIDEATSSARTEKRV